MNLVVNLLESVQLKKILIFLLKLVKYKTTLLNQLKNKLKNQLKNL